MDDRRIIELFFERDSKAITECKNKYSRYLSHVAYGILKNNEDTEECVSDTYLKAWDTIPPQNPQNLKIYLAKIARNLALNIVRKFSAVKRGGGIYETVLDELYECIADSKTVESELELRELTKSINRFLDELDDVSRKVFVQRYWYVHPLSRIAKAHRLSESAVKSMLFRLRKRLKDHLMKDGIEI